MRSKSSIYEGFFSVIKFRPDHEHFSPNASNECLSLVIKFLRNWGNFKKKLRVQLSLNGFLKCKALLEHVQKNIHTSGIQYVKIAVKTDGITKLATYNSN